MKSVVFSPCPLCDADDAKNWYERCDSGLGSEFLRSLDECVARIASDPKRYRLFNSNYRKTLMRRFPFQIVYEEREECIWILAVYHSKRDPRQLDKRI